MAAILSQPQCVKWNTKISNECYTHNKTKPCAYSVGNTEFHINSLHFIWIGLIHMKRYAILKPALIGGLGRSHRAMKQYLDAGNGQIWTGWTGWGLGNPFTWLVTFLHLEALLHYQNNIHLIIEYAQGFVLKWPYYEMYVMIVVVPVPW